MVKGKEAHVLKEASRHLLQAHYVELENGTDDFFSEIANAKCINILWDNSVNQVYDIGEANDDDITDEFKSGSIPWMNAGVNLVEKWSRGLESANKKMYDAVGHADENPDWT